jgi:hypothetical protein
MLIKTLLDTFTEFMYNTNEKILKKKNIFSSNEAITFFWVAAILVGRSERGKKQNFILGLILLF